MTTLFENNQYRITYDGIDSVQLWELEGEYAPYLLSTVTLSPLVSKSWNYVMTSLNQSAAYRMKVVNFETYRWVTRLPAPAVTPWMK